MPLKPYFENAGITLYHGDCREVLRELSSETFDLVLTDPPYLVSYSGRWGSEWGIIQGDSDPIWVAPAFIECWRVLKPDSLCISFYGWPHTDTFVTTWKLVGISPGDCSRPCKGPPRPRPVHTRAARTGVRACEGSAREAGNGHQRCTPLGDYDSPTPNQKPLGASSKLVGTYSAEHGVILDPFCGSGTTLLAARNLGRRAVGIEIEERYCEVAALRLSHESLDFEKSESSPVQMMLLGDFDSEARSGGSAAGPDSSGGSKLPQVQPDTGSGNK